jgi:hypothetical protein
MPHPYWQNWFFLTLWFKGKAHAYPWAHINHPPSMYMAHHMGIVSCQPEATGSTGLSDRSSRSTRDDRFNMSQWSVQPVILRLVIAWFFSVRTSQRRILPLTLRSCLAITVLSLCTDLVLRLQCAQILSCDYSVVFVQFPPFLFCMLCTLALCSEWVSGCEFSRCLGFQAVHDVVLPTQCASWRRFRGLCYVC